MRQCRLPLAYGPKSTEPVIDHVLVARLGLLTLLAPIAIPILLFLGQNAVRPAEGDVRPAHVSDMQPAKKLFLRIKPVKFRFDPPIGEPATQSGFGNLTGEASVQSTTVRLSSPVLDKNLVLHDSNHAIRLFGVSPLDESRICVRLDGVRETCAQRAVERVAALVEGRLVQCTEMPATMGSGTGRCFADKIDIAADLAANGLVK